jgi:hypothetical protein
MRVLSDPTLGLVVEVAARQFSDEELRTLLMRADLWQYSGVKRKRQELVRDHLLSARDYADEYGSQMQDVRLALLTFIRMIVERTVRDPTSAPTWFGELCEALLADGYELTWELGKGDWGLPQASNYQILPTDPGPVPLNTEISALEADLRSRGYDQALNHYKQAIEAFGRHDYEAANSQLRTALEDLLMQLAEDHTSYTRPAKAGDGWNAIEKLAQQPTMAAADGGDVLKGLWAMSHTKGSHPGRSDADETRFRLQAITATARLLLHRFPARS